MRTSFKNSPLKIFAVSGVIITLSALVFGLVGGIYFSTKKNGSSMGTIPFGESITLSDFAKQQDISSPWIKNGTFSIETEMEVVDGSRVIVPNVVTVDKVNKSIRFNGVGKGKMTLYYSLDKSIYYTLDFASDFRNTKLTELLMEQCPAFFEDGFLDLEEINEIENIRIHDVNTFLGEDLGYFLNLKSISLDSESVIKMSHLTLQSSTKIYVPKDLYGDYMVSEGYSAFTDNIFPSKPSESYQVIVLYKNGGKMDGSWDEEYDSFEVTTGSYFDDLPDARSISKRGSTFVGWFDKNNVEYTVNTPIVKDVKLYARWSIDEYRVTYHIEKPSGGFDVDYDSYYLDDDLDIRDIETSYDTADRKFIGWAYANDATIVDFGPLYHEDGYFDGIKQGFDLYAVFAHKNVEITIFNKTIPVLETTCSYGNSFILKYAGSEPSGEGKFIGYSRSETARTKEYDDNNQMLLRYNPENPEDPTSLYRTTKQDNKLLFYCVFNDVNSYSVFYNYTNANEVSSTLAQTHKDYDDESSGNLIAGREVRLRSPDSMYFDEVNNIDKVGKHFVGWLRIMDNKEYLYTNLSNVPGFNGTIVPLGDYWLDNGFYPSGEVENVELSPYYVLNKINIKYIKRTEDTEAPSNQIINYGTELKHSVFKKAGKEYTELKISSNNLDIEYLDVSTSMTSISADKMKEFYQAAMMKNNISRNQNADGMTISIEPIFINTNYTITFNANGGSPTPASQTHWYGEKITKPSFTPSKSDYTFAYWYISSGSELNFNTYTVYCNVTIYAAYNKNPGCLIEGTSISLFDNTFKNIEDVQVGDLVKTWSFLEGDFAYEPVIAIESGYTSSTAVHLRFANGKEETIIGSHAFFDYTRMEYVNISTDNYLDYVGDLFFFEDGVSELNSSELILYEGSYYFLITAHNMNSFANGALNIVYEVNFMTCISSINDMKFDLEELNSYIDIYGLANYEDYSFLVDEYTFDAFNGEYLNILIGRDIISIEMIAEYLQMIS